MTPWTRSIALCFGNLFLVRMLAEKETVAAVFVIGQHTVVAISAHGALGIIGTQNNELD